MFLAWELYMCLALHLSRCNLGFNLGVMTFDTGSSGLRSCAYSRVYWTQSYWLRILLAPIPTGPKSYCPQNPIDPKSHWPQNPTGPKSYWPQNPTDPKCNEIAAPSISALRIRLVSHTLLHTTHLHHTYPAPHIPCSTHHRLHSHAHRSSRNRTTTACQIGFCYFGHG